MFRKVNVGKYTEYNCDFGKHLEGRFFNYCTVRMSENYENAYQTFISTDGNAPLTIPKASLIFYDKEALNYVKAYLHQPETDSFIRFTPEMWGSEDLLDYGTLIGGQLYIFDADVQIHKAANLSVNRNPLGGLEDEEGYLVLTTCYIFVEYLRD